MRICYLADAQSAHTQRWVRAVQERGHEVIIISFRPAQIDDIPVYHIHTPKLVGISPTAPMISRYHYLFARRKTQKIIDTYKPDIVHAFYATSYGFLGARLKVPVYFISVWGQDITRSKKQILMQLIVKYALSRARKIFCTSNFLVQEAAAVVNDKQKLIEIPFGIDLEKFVPVNKGKQRDTFILGSLKPLEDFYGITILLSAFKQAWQINNKLRLMLLKSGKLLKDTEMFIKKNNFTQIITLVPPVQHNDVPKLLQQFDALVIPSLIESFGVAALEGSACQLPVIASNVGGLPEVVQHEKTGVMVTPGSVNALAEAMLKLSDNPILCRDYGRNGRKFVSDKFNWNLNVNALVQEYLT